MIQQEKPLQRLKPSLLIQQAVDQLQTQLIPVLGWCLLPHKLGLLKAAPAAEGIQEDGR